MFAADDEVGGDLARVDWTSTPLGVPAGWPQSLRTAVSILLSSRFSMWMAWGPELTFFCNAAYRRDTLGRKYPWALGRPASEVWAEIWDDIGPRIQTVLSTGKATWDEALLLFLERSGYPEETYHTFSYSPLRDDTGQVVGMLCVVTEETERVIGERRMAMLRDLGSDPSVVQTEQQVLAFAGRQLGQDLRDLPFTLTYLFDRAGAVLVATTGVEVEPAATAWPVDAVAGGEAVVVELDSAVLPELPTGSWPEPPDRALVVPLRQQGSTPYGFLVAALNRYRELDDGYRGFIDLVAGHIAAGIASARSYQAQQRRAEELAELDRAKTTFFSNISHEFRTPLTLILGPVQELRGRWAEADARDREELEVVHRNSLRLSKLVNTLLDFSRIEAGRMRARYEPVDLAAVTAELASVFRSAVERAGLTFTVDCPPLREPVHLDRGMWEQVVFNLLSNALKFTFDGAITVTVGRDDERAVVTVTDTGVGVPAAEMPRLFERFHRIENTRARSGEGSGIGLALVRELVELHGGTIAAESTEGAGTAFVVRLPFGAAHLPAEALAPAATHAAPSPVAEQYVQEALRWLPDEAHADNAPRPAEISAAVPARVLVADDNADMREYLTRLLRDADYVVTTAVDGRKALEAARTDPPDLVISDVMMPGLDGLALVAELRGDARTAAVPVLLLSARAGQEAAIEGLQAGADDYLVKPFAAAELLARVRANVELARLRNHHARWRTALVDSLQEAFFVCDEHGSVVEINATFTDILGFGPEGLPYEPLHPWWPDAATDPDAHEQTAEAFAVLLGDPQGSYTVPVTHRDGHRVWVTASFNHVDDPETGRQVTVGTFRDVTGEHYTVQRQAALATLSQQLAQADTVAEAVTASVEELRRVWKARRVLAVTFPALAEPQLVCAGEPRQWTQLPPEVRQTIEALRTGDPLIPATGDPGAVGVALQHPAGVLVLWLELAERRRFTSEDETLLTVLAGRLGQGLSRVHQHDQQRETALALQHAILGPQNLPGAFAVRYQPATRPLQVGGDWYDVVDLDDGRIALVVGDCVGHGLAAATVMGQLRSACRALLLEHSTPAAALAALDRFAARLPGATCTTALCAVLTPETGELAYSSAGHPPPVLVHADRTTQLLEDGHSVPLGVRADVARPEARIVIPPRGTLLLYTDGLVERRRRPLDEGISRAAELLENSSTTTPDELADKLMTGLAPAAGYEDDVAVLLYRQPGPLDIGFPADAGQLAPTRRALRGWLDRCGLDAEQIQNVLVAVGEAVANAIEHGHRDTPGDPIRLSAIALADQVHVTVTDSGTWKAPQPSENSRRGRGMTLMRELVSEVSVHPTTGGTAVHLHARIPV
ncbi:SpoIIE family protein phosphatase [Amycolatopsis solani]|uniref:SpoIIE family protein phosphatase n=1 Tax=Amycolatopsis solani TaxID=3028615 RepID=UPI0025B0BCD5|nr:SpoIIE family protein phosphatase [Amycolatopsis sp. MEP2-6]